jgi:capsular exopolysaccharide synthesis family protein
LENQEFANLPKKVDVEIYQRWLHRILSHWHLFVIAIFIAYAATWTYLKYTTTVYTVGASIMVKDASQNINPFERSGEYVGYVRNYNLSNDIKVFTSRRLVEETLQKINWKVSYLVLGNFKNTEVYNFIQFEVVIPDSNNIIPFNNQINIKFNRNSTYELSFADDKIDLIKFQNPYETNKDYIVDGFRFNVKTTGGTESLKDTPYGFIVNQFDNVVNEYIGKLKVMHMDKSSSILALSSIGNNQEKEKDFINKHCQSCVRVSLIEKNLMNEKVISFVNEQMQVISDTLSDIEFAMIGFKKKFNSSNIENLAERKFIKIDQLEEQKGRIILDGQYLNYLKQYLKRQSDYTEIVAPSAVGVRDQPLLSSLITQLIDLKMKQNISFRTENAESPFRKENESRINKILTNIFELIGNIEETNIKAIADIQRQIDGSSSLTTDVLQNEKNFVELKRQYRVNEELYNILLKRGAEMSIIKAGNLSDSKVIDNATVQGILFPIASKLYIRNLLIAFLLPLLYTILKYITNYRILEKSDVTAVCDIPFLGNIGHIEDSDRLVVVNKPKSLLAESFRTLRANLNFYLGRPDQKIILITSSLSGEGKTFTSLNIASVLAISGKKVILIGADMRKPKVYLDINVRNTSGLSNFLSYRATIDSIIAPTSVENLFFINSGILPPNPAELLMSPKIEELFNELKLNFDYIILDTPPIGLVTDALSLMKYSDINIFIVRHNYTQSRYLKSLKDMVDVGIVNNIMYIMNDFDISRNYGSGYTYGYTSDRYGIKNKEYGYYDDENKPRGIFGFLVRLFSWKRKVKKYHHP